jgi:hypothetical protein
MDRSEVCYLISQTHTRDANGIMQPTETSTQVFCDVQSVSASEWFEGGRSGLNPELRFTLFEGDYSGQEIVKFNNVRYAVYRTYRAKHNNIELYVQKEGGVL